MAAENKEAILSRLRDTLNGLVRGVFGLAVVQGVLNGVGFALLGAPLPALLGMTTALLSPIPFLGVLVLLIPLAIAMAIAGSDGATLLAAAWCLGVSFFVERVLRPRVIGPRNEIPVLLLFFGLLGGMRVYGVGGALLGPVLIALTLAFVNVYRREYHWLLEHEER
jgi:predicted PurR-regulated permease PerM